MGLYNPSSVVHENVPREFPHGLVHIFDMVVGPDDIVSIFVDDPVSPGYLDIYADAVKHDEISAGGA
jgi:hypothetical protein